MANNNTTHANALIQEQVSTMLVEPLEATSVVLAASPSIFNSSEPLKIPTLTDGFTPGLVGEGELIPEDDAAFGEIALMPSSRKSIKSVTRVTNELIRSAKMGVSNVLQQRLVKDVANKLDTELLKGTGADNGITGILNQPGVQTAVLDSANPDSILDAVGLARAAEVKPNRIFMSGADYLALSKLKNNTGDYILQATAAIDGTLTETLFGIPVTVTNKLAKGEGFMADMKEVAVVRDIDPTVKVDESIFFLSDEVGIRVTTRYDLGLIHPEGVIVFGAGE